MASPTLHLLQRILRLPAVSAAARHVRLTDARTLQDQVELTLIPAPSFNEGMRGARMAELLEEAGAREVRVDAAGNVLGRYDGVGDPAAPPLVVSAHLDTAFPPGTPVELRREGTRLLAPGITDDGRGLAALLALARALRAAEVPLEAPVLLVATVGEEGAGDLRGVKYLFRSGGPAASARGFLSLDGAGLDGLVIRGVGSRRLRITLTGPGGHSWADFGMPNPIHILGDLVGRIGRTVLPDVPRTTCTVARWGGGTGINAIPGSAWIEVDCRSEDPSSLHRLEQEVREGAEEAVRRTMAASAAALPRPALRFEIIGDRPAGSTDPEDPLVRSALAATRAVGGSPVLLSASTDANLAMSLGIPALTMGAGGRAGGAHTLEEWYENATGPEGVLRALYTVLLAAGVPIPAAAPGD